MTKAQSKQVSQSLTPDVPNSLGEIGRSFKARGKHHRNAAQDTFKWIIYTGLLGIVLAIFVPPITTVVDRYVKPKVTTEELVNLRARIAQVKKQIVDASSNYDKEFLNVQSWLQLRGSYFVPSSFLISQKLNIESIEDKWVGSDGLQYILVRARSTVDGESEKELLRYVVIELSPGKPEPGIIRKFGFERNQRVVSTAIDQHGVYVIFVQYAQMPFDSPSNWVETSEIEITMRFIPHNVGENEKTKILSKEVRSFNAETGYQIDTWKNGAIFIAGNKIQEGQTGTEAVSLYLFEPESSKITPIIANLPIKIELVSEIVVAGDLALILQSDFFRRETNSARNVFYALNLDKKTMTEMQVPPTVSADDKLFITNLFVSGDFVDALFSQTITEGSTSTTRDFALASFDTLNLKFGERFDFDTRPETDLLNAREVVRGNDGSFSLLGSLSTGLHGVDRAVFCMSASKTLNCTEFSQNNNGLDGESLEKVRIGSTFLGSIGDARNLLDREILVSSGYDSGLRYYSDIKWTNQLISLGNGQYLTKQINDQTVALTVAQATTKKSLSDDIVNSYKSTLSKANRIEALRVKEAVLANAQFAAALGATIPLFRSLREVEHLPEALPILESAGATSDTKLGIDSELRDASSASTQAQQIVTRIAVLAIFAYLLHLLVVRQRIQQVLEEHNEARYHALKLMAGRKDRLTDPAAEAKLLQELVAFSDASLRIPPNPPAPPISKLAEAIRTAMEKVSGK